MWMKICIIIDPKKKKKEQEKEGKVEVAGKTKTLFCPECHGFLYLDRETGFHKCRKCGKYWKYIGDKMLFKIPRIQKMKQKGQRLKKQERVK
ncbi:hypothetical protein J7K03_00100 [bacterium]|nr:hypothetical protein [bacterium]